MFASTLLLSLFRYFIPTTACHFTRMRHSSLRIKYLKFVYSFSIWLTSKDLLQTEHKQDTPFYVHQLESASVSFRPDHLLTLNRPTVVAAAAVGR